MVLEQLTELLGTRNTILFLLIGLTFIAILMFTSRARVGYERYYYRAKRMRRKQIEQHISWLERQILKLDKIITSLKIREQDLEIRFSAQRDASSQKELQRLRKKLTQLANKRDRLLEEKQAYSRAYREVTI